MAAAQAACHRHRLQWRRQRLAGCRSFLACACGSLKFHSAAMAAMIAGSLIPSPLSSATCLRSRRTITRRLLRHHFVQLRADEQNRHSLIAQLIDEPGNLEFAPTSMPRVGSSRISSFGSVRSQRPRMAFCWFPPLRNLMGLSASEVAMRTDVSPGDFALPASRDPPQPAEPSLQGQNDVFAQGEIGDHSGGLAIFRATGDPARRSPRAGREGKPAGPGSGSRRCRAIHSEEQSDRFGAARAEQSGQADHLAASDVQIERFDRAAPAEPASFQKRRESGF